MKDTYWFKHDSNAKDDPKCVLLLDQLGPEGYGIFWLLIETLREQPEYRYPLNLLPALARRYNTTSEKIGTVIRSYGLFVILDDNIFFSESLTRRMLPLEKKRENNRRAAQIRWEESERNANALQMHNGCTSDAMQKRIEENREENIPTNVGSSPNSDGSPDKKERIDYQKIIDLYNSTCISLPKVEKLTDPRRQKIRIRINELKKQYPERQPNDVLEEIFRKAEASDFLKGSTGWKTSFDWIFGKGDNWIKILEGNYENRQQNAQTDKSDNYMFDNYL